jgi:predicted ATP-dependent endonuclease of OLD family
MKISHISIRNFRTFREFDADFRDYNVIIGPNNTGKSNLLHAIDTFYTNKASIEDFKKNGSANPNNQEFSITLTYDNLSDDEKRELASYLLKNDIFKVIYRGTLSEDSGFLTEYHGYILESKFIFPDGFDDTVEKILFSKHYKPVRNEFKENPEINQLLENFCPSGKIKIEDRKLMGEKFLAQHPEIEVRKEEVESESNFQGFARAKNPDRSGVCIFIPAIGKTSADSEKALIGQLIHPFLEGVGIEDAKPEFEIFQQKIMNARLKKKQDLEEKINSELELWNTTAEIQFNPTPIEEISPMNLSILFNDGIQTALEKKGTGLQRYIFFKTLKILNEEKYTTDKSFIFLFEEPEAHLHPQLQKEIFETLRQLSNNPILDYQIILTTHSPQFVDIENLDELYIFSKDEQGCSDLQKCNIHFSGDRDLVKTILSFNPHISEIFFANQVILFEGQSEEISFNYLRKEGIFNISQTSLVNAKGKYNLEVYIKILNEIGLPYTVLIDEDPYFLPHFKSFDRIKIKDKKKAYKKNQEIIDLIDDSLGRAVVLSPDFDQYVGISKNTKSKPTKIYQKLIQYYEKTPDIHFQKKIENLLDLLLNPLKIPFKAINPDKTKWEEVDPSSVKTMQPSIGLLIKKIKQVKDKFSGFIKSLSGKDIQKLKDIF